MSVLETNMAFSGLRPWMLLWLSLGDKDDLEEGDNNIERVGSEVTEP